MSVSDTVEPPGGLAGEAPLSFNQEFLCLFDRGRPAGPFDPRYHIVHGWRLRGQVDEATMHLALADVVARHRTLRTSIVTGSDGVRCQRVHSVGAPQLLVRDLSDVDPKDREERVEELLNEIESSTFDTHDLPLIRAVLGRFDANDAILVLIAHHAATDGWSMRLIIRDLATRYATRRGLTVADLPVSHQYQEYAVWQRRNATDTADADYWREKLRDARICVLPTDQPRSANAPEATGVHRFTINADLISATVRVARAMRCTPFMVLLAAYQVLMARMTGTTDIVVPTFTPGRDEERFHQTVGSFFNFLPLRTDLGGCQTFGEVVRRTRRTCVEAYSHDIPTMRILAEAPQLMAPAMTDNFAPCVFQVFLVPSVLDGDQIGAVEYSEVRRRLRSQPVGSDVPDGALWTLNLHPAGDVVGSVQFRRNLFEEGTMEGLVDRFRRVLAELVTAPDAPLLLA